MAKNITFNTDARAKLAKGVNISNFLSYVVIEERTPFLYILGCILHAPV